MYPLGLGSKLSIDLFIEPICGFLQWSPFIVKTGFFDEGS